jgi:hypothetical protein
VRTHLKLEARLRFLWIIEQLLRGNLAWVTNVRIVESFHARKSPSSVTRYGILKRITSLINTSRYLVY